MVKQNFESTLWLWKGKPAEAPEKPYPWSITLAFFAFLAVASYINSGYAQLRRVGNTLITNSPGYFVKRAFVDQLTSPGNHPNFLLK